MATKAYDVLLSRLGEIEEQQGCAKIACAMPIELSIFVARDAILERED